MAKGFISEADLTEIVAKQTVTFGQTGFFSLVEVTSCCGPRKGH